MKILPYLSKKHANRQKGNALLTTVIAILLGGLIVVLGIPAAGRYIVNASIPPVVDELQRYIAALKITAQGEGVSPFEGLTQTYFARQLSGSSMKIDTSSGVVLHGLGGGSNGTITITETGDTASFNFADVSQYACPGLPSSMQRGVNTIRINGTTVKDTDENNSVTTEYNSNQAGASCVDGDNNEIVFTIRS